MFYRQFLKFLVILFILTFAIGIFGQRKKVKVPAKPAIEANEPTLNHEPADTGKKNARPDETDLQTPVPGKKNAKTNTQVSTLPQKKSETKFVYFYEFSQPEFTVSKIRIELGDNGIGTIRFMKKYYDEEIEDPIILSPAAAEHIRSLWTNLNFLDSTDNYQYEKDYSHLGNLKFTMKKDGRQRTAEFNWSENPDAKALADEYRKIGNQYIWIFDMNLSRENQPLESAKIMNALDSMISRNEIAFPQEMLPYLKDLANDERIPLLSRNHATRIVNSIEKTLAKKKEDKP